MAPEATSRRWHAKCKQPHMELTGGIGVVTCLVEMRFVPVEADRALRLLVTVVERIKAKAGCEACWVSRDAIEPCRIRYCETWGSNAPFQVHVRSEEFRHVVTALDMCCEEPKVTIGELTGRTGIEVLKEFCNGREPDSSPHARPK